MILVKFYFCVTMDRDEVEVHENAKKRTRPISSHLDRTSLVNKGFITWPKNYSLLLKIPSRQGSSNQSEHRIRFILPAYQACRIRNTRIIIQISMNSLSQMTLVLPRATGNVCYELKNSLIKSKKKQLASNKTIQTLINELELHAAFMLF